MDFAKAVAIFIASELAPSMVDTLMVISAGLQTGINAVLICIHPRTRDDRVFDEGFDGLLLHISQQMDHHLTTALHHPKDRGSFLRQGASTRFAFASASTTWSALALDHLWLSFMA